MLKTLDELLFYSVKIFDTDGGQIINKALENHIKNLDKLGILDAHEKVNSLFEDNKYDYVNDENLNDDQRHAFAQAHKTIVFANATSIKNVADDEQKELILKLSNLVAKTFEEDKKLQLRIEDINHKVKNGDVINLHDINFELINITQDRIKSDKTLQLEIAQLMIENFEILLENKVECKSDFIQFITENDEIINSEAMQEEVRQRVAQLKIVFDLENQSRIEIIKHPVKTIKSFIARIGCERRNKQQLWVDRIKSRDMISQKL